MESSYEMVEPGHIEASQAAQEHYLAVDLTPSLERTMFRFHNTPESPRLDYSPSSASLPLSDTSDPHSPIGSIFEHSEAEAESLANLVLPRLDVMMHEGHHSGSDNDREEIRHRLKAIIVGSTEQNRLALKTALSLSNAGPVSIDYSTLSASSTETTTSDLFPSVFPPEIETAFLKLDHILARHIPTHLLNTAQDVISSAAPSYLNTVVLLLLDESELPEALIMRLRSCAAIITILAGSVDAKSSLDQLRQEGISTLSPQHLHANSSSFALICTASSNVEAPSSLTLEPDSASSTLPDLASLAVFQTILRENVRKFFGWRLRPRIGALSEHACTSTDEAQTRSQTDSLTGYVASQEDVGTSGEEEVVNTERSRRRRRTVVRERYSHYSPFPAPGFDPLLIGIRPLFSVGLASVGPWSARESLWRRFGKLACVCSGLYAFGCLIAWSFSA